MPTVLVVDDDTFVRSLLREILETGLVDGPVTVLEAENGAEAIARAAEHRPDLVFLDLFMPGTSGLEALPEIKAVSPGSRVVVVSSMETESMVAEALSRGAAAFVGKPFHPEEIEAIVRDVRRVAGG